MAIRFGTRAIEARIERDLAEHFQKSKHYFFNLLCLAGFVLIIGLFAVVQNHNSIHTNYYYYDLARYQGQVDQSVLNTYAQVKGDSAVKIWEQYKKTIRSSTLPVADQNYLLVQQALILKLPKSEETAKLSHFFEHEVKMADLNYMKVDHNILNKFVYYYSPYYGTESNKFVKIELRIDQNSASEIFRENSVQRFVNTSLGLIEQFNQIKLPVINVGILFVCLFAFIFAIIYGVFKNLMGVYDILND
jgi:hypothetical protein